MYQEQPSSSGGGEPLNAWSILSHTERWIHSTLASQSSSSSSNPYVRKEVSYVCEPTDSPVLLVAAVFRQLQEMRRLGETHVQQERQRERDCGTSYSISLYYIYIQYNTYIYTISQLLSLADPASFAPRTLRQTQVMVLPAVFTDSFARFDALVQAINQARRQARDLRISSASAEDDLDDARWSLALHCAHLHPAFGSADPVEDDDNDGTEEKDALYARQRVAARRSPYPTLVLEVRASPTPESFLHDTKANAEANADTRTIQQQLEALLGQSAHLKEAGDGFWDALGQSLPEVTTRTPLQRAQHWIATAHPIATAVVTVSDTRAIDEAYAFLFTNLAMFLQEPPSSSGGNAHFLVLPQLFPTSATSLERWTQHVGGILAALDLAGEVQLMIYHPEHVSPERRAPTPMIGLEYKKKKTD